MFAKFYNSHSLIRQTPKLWKQFQQVNLDVLFSPIIAK